MRLAQRFDAELRPRRLCRNVLASTLAATLFSETPITPDTAFFSVEDAERGLRWWCYFASLTYVNPLIDHAYEGAKSTVRELQQRHASNYRLQEHRHPAYGRRKNPLDW